MLRIVGLRFEKERDRGERERETYRERGRIKNDKEKIFKWSVKKIEVLM